MTSRAEAIDTLRNEVIRRAADFSQKLDQLVPLVLKKHKIEWSEFEPGTFDEVATNAAKDLEKLAIYQEDRIDHFKMIGYLCFWIRKLKPIRHATMSDSPVRDVNELVAIWLACEMLERRTVGTKDLAKPLKDAIIGRLKAFLQDSHYIEYIIHCMRARTFGPHHFVIMMRQLTVG